MSPEDLVKSGRYEIQPGYWVARDGSVFSSFSDRLLAPQTTVSGYQQIKLTGSKWFLVHRLVALAFVSGMTDERSQVNHKDGVKANNQDVNLEWVTGSENCLHAYRTGLQDPPAWTEESREKMASKHRGRKCSPAQIERMSAARKGKGTAPKSEEHKAKISAALKGRSKS